MRHLYKRRRESRSEARGHARRENAHRTARVADYAFSLVRADIYVYMCVQVYNIHFALSLSALVICYRARGEQQGILRAAVFYRRGGRAPLRHAEAAITNLEARPSRAPESLPCAAKSSHFLLYVYIPPDAKISQERNARIHLYGIYSI